LEKLQEEQRKMLEAERKKREEFEKTQNDKEKELKEAQTRVEEMERERRKLDKQLDHALEKAKAANHGQEVLETKIKIQEQETETELDKEAASESIEKHVSTPKDITPVVYLQILVQYRPLG
jgi:predicted nuclease with TOPRIM domain